MSRHAHGRASVRRVSSAVVAVALLDTRADNTSKKGSLGVYGGTISGGREGLGRVLARDGEP
jgi:hypothetical protein